MMMLFSNELNVLCQIFYRGLAMILEKFSLPEKYKTHHAGIDEQHTNLFSILISMLSLIKNPTATIDG